MRGARSLLVSVVLAAAVALAASSGAAAQEVAAPLQAEGCLNPGGAYREPGKGPCLKKVTRVVRGVFATFDPGFKVEVRTSCVTDEAGATVPQAVRLTGATNFEWYDQDVDAGRSWVLCEPSTDVFGPQNSGPLTAFDGLQLFGYNDAGLRFTERWALVRDGIKEASGRVRIKVTRLRAERYADIFDTSFDQYVNVCINGGHRIYAKGGHLYCSVRVQVGLTRVTARLG